MKKILPLSLFLLLFCASAVFGVDVYDYLNFYNNYISASNVTIDVKSNITFLASPSGTPTWPNNVANNKIINGLGDGGGRYELIGNNLSYGLVVENINSSYSPRTLSINNIIIRNMRAANGAIYLYSRRNQPDSHITLNIYNVDFDSNNRAINTFYGTATNARSIIINAGGTNVFLNNTFAGAGGAINLVARTITAFTNSDTTFIGNSATGASGLGGAIYMTGGTSAGIESLLNFTNSNITFSGNSAGGSGGVIYLADRTTATFTNSTVIFTGNSAVSDGGAIYIFGTNNSFLNFANSNLTFTSNTSRSGGAIYVADSGSRLSFLGSAVTAIGNQANGTGVNGNGGFLYLNGQSVTFDRNVNLTSNTANRSGGGIYAAAAGTMLTFTGNTMTFNYNKASGNGSGSGGGAMYLADRTTATFTNSTVIFTGNSAVMDGGAINIAGPNNSFLNFANSNLTFTSNTANNGGAIYAGSGSRLSFLGSALTATGNNAGSYGGFLYLNGQSVTFDRDVNLISNTAAINGGGIYAAAGTSLTFTGNTKTFNYNTATFGGAMYLDRTNTIFTNNTV
ncbi:MAG: hypothetical protein FWG51_05390, partial [Firmicutes bacterium]|nr:hypothetical protein [Bacillota bacterium]